MASVTGEPSPEAARDERVEPAGLGRISFLEQALWQQFSEATAPEAFARAWLALQCTLIHGVEHGVVVLGEPDTGPFAPVSYWPAASGGNPGLANIAELALKERRGVVQGAEEAARTARGGQPWYVGYPFLVDRRLFGVAALELDAGRRDQLRSVMRQLQWGAGWIEVMLRRQQLARDSASVARMATAFDLVATALDHARFRDACNAAVTELAMRLDCDQVSVGFVRRQRVVVAAISHAAQFGQRMNLVRDLGAAMDEAVDQRAMVLYPPAGDWEYRIDRAHRELMRANGAGAILTVPLHAGGRFFGALTFERPSGATFDEAAVMLCDCIANVVGPLLEEKRQNDRLIIVKAAEAVWLQVKRLFGPRYFGRKLATALAVVVVGFFAAATGEYRVTAPAVLEGSVQRSLVAPFEGYIASQSVRAGDVVRQGEVMATLDEKDLVTERLKWLTKRQQQLTEYDKALAKDQRAEAEIDQAQVAQADAQVALLDAEIARTRIVAPFDGLVISGDLSQSVGAAVKRGDELFQVAPLESYRVVLKVDERDIADIKAGQRGMLLVSSLPLRPLHYRITRVTPIAEAQEGVNYFRVEAALEELNNRLRPGMRGIGKTDIDSRLLIRIWTKRLVDWARLTAWEWRP
jgi:RND family efflux transporter MFP subunit